MKINSVHWKMLILGGVLFGLLGAAPVASAKNSNSGVIPPQAIVQGNTYGEWSAAFWQWLFSIPVDQNPAFDVTGVNALVGQAGTVWFLPGVFNVSGSAAREITIPAGISLFVTIINLECSTVEAPPFFGATDAELTACATGFSITDMAAELDGRSIDFTSANYQATSPPFDFELPENNILGVSADFGRAVSNGYYLMLAPLPVGDHTLHFTGTYPDFPFTLDISYLIHVAHDAKK